MISQGNNKSYFIYLCLTLNSYFDRIKPMFIFFYSTQIFNTNNRLIFNKIIIRTLVFLNKTFIDQGIVVWKGFSMICCTFSNFIRVQWSFCILSHMQENFSRLINCKWYKIENYSTVMENKFISLFFFAKLSRKTYLK